MWGGHKGSGLAIMTQMLGFLAGATVEPDYLTDHAYLIIVIDPDIFGHGAGAIDKVSDFTGRIRRARPLDHDQPVRLPFDGSRERRQVAIERGWIEVDDVVVARAKAIASS